LTGSSPTPKTIGIVVVAAFAASAASPAEQSPNFPISFAQVGAVLGAGLGLALMIGRLIFKFSAPLPDYD